MAISKIILNGVTQMDLTSDSVTAATLLSPQTAHGADGEPVVGTASQGITPTGSLNINANGTFDVTNYASAVVNVAGGASNVVTGTFKGTTTGAAMDVTIPYTGSGYPVAFAIYVSEGAYNVAGTYYSLLQRYVFGFVYGVKHYFDRTPSYKTSSAENYFMVMSRYKSSTTNAQSHSNSGSFSNAVTSGGGATGSVSTPVTFKNDKTMSVYIASNSYGFAANIEYTYHIIYSS